MVDLVIDGRLIASAPVRADGTFGFDDLSAGEKVVELWLPQFVDFRLVGIGFGADASVWPAPDPRQPRLITYGSSITHCPVIAPEVRRLAGI